MLEMLKVDVVRLPSASGLSLPTYQTAGAAGTDILAALENDLRLEPGAVARVPTGLVISIPLGWEAQIGHGLDLRFNTP